MHAIPLSYMPPPPITHAPAPVDRMAHACENITFLQLLLRTVTIVLESKQ